MTTPLGVLRQVWSAASRTTPTVLDDIDDPKICKRTEGLDFGDFGDAEGVGSGGDLRTAWRAKLAREGKLAAGPDAVSIRELCWAPTQSSRRVRGGALSLPTDPAIAAPVPQSVAELTEQLRAGGYLADRGLATALFVSLSLERPILLEGEVGVGKTEVAKVLASIFGRKLIRLQCYEGIDTNQALYEWDYARQMLQIRALSEQHLADEDSVDTLFGPKFLLERPLLEAVRAGDQAVLLIDEVDRADDEFEAFLLEVLSDYQISIPEIGTITAVRPPLVILTSNRTRELHDALKRRCLYHWVGYPSAEREVEIVLLRAPGIAEALARKVVAAVNRLRELDLVKPPGVAETIDWVRTLDVLGETDLDVRVADDTLGAVIKERDDLDLVRANLEEITSGA